jgi:hypothetical protein
MIAANQDAAAELIALAKELREDVLAWLKKHHPRLLF